MSIFRICRRTGVKCLPATRLPRHGELLHDSHAEIIARRGFVLWMYDEIAKFRRNGDTSKYLAYADSDERTLLRLKSEYRVLFYVSTLPCQCVSIAKIN